MTPAEACRARALATIEAAVSSWPEARSALAESAAAAARARAEGGAGSPFLAWTSEGLDGSLSRTANAQDVLHLGMPFNWPGQGAAARAYRAAADEAADVGRTTIALRVALEAGGAWIERAGALDRVAVHRARLGRIDRALSLQEARYQLGEVSGSEVMQLDLEHVRETSQLAVAEAEAAGMLERMTELCGAGCVDALPGDLAVLAEATATPERSAMTEQAVETGGLLKLARATAEARRAQTELTAATAFGRPSAGLEWERVPSIDGMPSFDAFGFALSFPLPFGSAGRQLQEAARLEAAASDHRVEAIRLELVRRSRVALGEAEAAAQRLGALNTALVELDRIEHSLDEQFRLGAVSYLVYLDGLNRLDEVRLDAIEARQQLLMARLELAAILSDPSVFPVVTLNSEERTP